MLVAFITTTILLFSPPSAAHRMDRLVALAHLDLAVRYFDPNVATKAARWDSLFAANVISIADAPDAGEYSRRISGLMLALGDSAVHGESPQHTLRYNGFPSPTSTGSGGYALEWKTVPSPVTYRVAMGEGTNVEIALSSIATPADTAAKVSAPPSDPAWRVAYPPAGHRLLGVMRVWSTFRLFNPYQQLTGENWDEQLVAALAAAEQANTGADYAKVIAAFAARVHDTHVTLGGGDMRFVVPNVPVGAQARLIENQLVITRVIDTNAAHAGLRVGDVVLSVDDETIEARIVRLLPYMPASTPQALRYRLQSALMNGSNTTPARLVVRRAAGSDLTISVPRSGSFYQQGLGKHRTGNLIRMLPGNIGYIDLERLPLQMVDSAFRVLAGTKAIILDDRGYPLGTAWAIASRLNVHGDRTTAAKFKRRIVSSPDTARTTMYEFDQPIPPANGVARYTGRTVMLIDERAISQAEHTGLFFEAANGTKFIGSPTMGSNGDVTYFFVPGGINISFTGHDVRHADGRQLQRVGLQPDLTVLQTIAGIRAGRDEVLQAAHRFLGGNGEIPDDTVVAVVAPAVAAANLPAEQMPAGWFGGAVGFRVGLDRSTGRSAGASGHITALSATPEGFAALNQVVRADDYRGKRVRFSAYVKTRNVALGASLWMRVDGGGGMLAFDNMGDRPISGTAEWTRASVVLDVPVEGEGINFGLLLRAGGEAWIDDASFEIVGPNVASTNMIAPTSDPSKVAEQRASYARSPRAPLNLALDP